MAVCRYVPLVNGGRQIVPAGKPERLTLTNNPALQAKRGAPGSPQPRAALCKECPLNPQPQKVVT